MNAKQDEATAENRTAAGLAAEGALILARIPFGVWTIYRAVPLLWSFATAPFGVAPVSGVQALAAVYLVRLFRGGFSAKEPYDDDFSTVSGVFRAYNAPVTLWLAVGICAAISWWTGA